MISIDEPLLQGELDYLRSQAIEEERLAAASWDAEGEKLHRAFAAVFRKYAAKAECARLPVALAATDQSPAARLRRLDGCSRSQ